MRGKIKKNNIYNVFVLSYNVAFAEYVRQPCSVHKPSYANASNQAKNYGDGSMCQASGVEGEDRQDVFGKHSEDGVEDVDRQSVAAYVVHSVAQACRR